MAVITGDFETYWAADYSVKNNDVGYVLDPKFQTILCAVKVDNKPTEVFVGHDAVARRFARVDWAKSAFLAHNCRFDGSILAWHYRHEPRLYLDTVSMARAVSHWRLGSSSLKAVSDYLKLPPKGTGAMDARGKRLEDFAPAELDDYAEYCRRDADNCYEIFERLAPVFPQSELRLMDLFLRMFISPQIRLDGAALTEYLAQLRDQKQAALEMVAGIDKSVFSSNQKFAALLAGMGVELPYKTSPATGKEIPALAKNDRGFRELCEDPELPVEVQSVLAARMGVKSTIEETRAEKMLTLSARAWPRSNTTGWGPVSIRYYGARCVPGDVEVLTSNGWVRLDAWPGGDIAQVHPDQTIEFLPAAPFYGPVEEVWVSVNAIYMQCQFTGGHTMPYLKHGSFAWSTMKAEDILDRVSLYVPTSGTLKDGGSITPEQMRVLAMVQADGRWQVDTSQGRELRIKVKKPRKIQRVRKLLSEAGVPFDEAEHASAPGFVRFTVRGRDWPAWLTPKRKVFGAWLLDSTPAAREALLTEIQHWDGWVQGNQVCYSSSVRENVDWVATLAHLTGRGASIGVHDRGERRQINYRVQVRARAHCIVLGKEQAGAVIKPQRTYCATTQTGFFLARSNGRIFVSGNTGRPSGDSGLNWLNLKRGSKVREAIVAPDGYRIVHRDSSQIEARMVAWLANCKILLDAFGQGRDVYCEFGEVVFGKAITKEDKLERFISKTGILGLGYGCGWEKFRHMLFIGSGGLSYNATEAEAKTIVYDKYRRIYPQIPLLWTHCEGLIYEIIAKSGRAEPYIQRYLQHTPALSRPLHNVVKSGFDAIHLPNGLVVNYPNIRTDYDPATGESPSVYDDPYKNPVKIYGAKCLENISQALARIVVTDVAVRAYDLTGFHPFLTTYDSLDFCVPREDAQWWDEYLATEFARVPEWAPGLPLASEGGWGISLADAERGRNQ